MEEGCGCGCCCCGVVLRCRKPGAAAFLAVAAAEVTVNACNGESSSIVAVVVAVVAAVPKAVEISEVLTIVGGMLPYETISTVACDCGCGCDCSCGSGVSLRMVLLSLRVKYAQPRWPVRLLQLGSVVVVVVVVVVGGVKD